MPLPELTDSGELPVGVHQASLRDTLRCFGGGDPQRIAVGEQPAVEYWQTKRGGGQRGIIEIVEETND